MVSKIRLNQWSNISFVDKFKKETRKALSDHEVKGKENEGRTESCPQ